MQSLRASSILHIRGGDSKTSGVNLTLQWYERRTVGSVLAEVSERSRLVGARSMRLWHCGKPLYERRGLGEQGIRSGDTVYLRAGGVEDRQRELADAIQWDDGAQVQSIIDRAPSMIDRAWATSTHSEMGTMGAGGRPLHWAAMNLAPNASAVLLRAGAATEDKCGETYHYGAHGAYAHLEHASPLHLATASASVVSPREHWRDPSNLLLLHDADVSSRAHGRVGSTRGSYYSGAAPTHVAAMLDDEYVQAGLLERNADLEAHVMTGTGVSTARDMVERNCAARQLAEARRIYKQERLHASALTNKSAYKQERGRRI